MEISRFEKKIKTIDIEVCPKWWCIVSICNDIPTIIRSDDNDYQTKIRYMVYDTCFVGTNIKMYDMKLLNAIQNDLDCAEVFNLSMAIQSEKEHYMNNFKYWNKYDFSDLLDDYKNVPLKDLQLRVGLLDDTGEVPYGRINLEEQHKLSIINYCIKTNKLNVLLFKRRKKYLENKVSIAEYFNIPKNKALKSTYIKLVDVIFGGKGRDKGFSPIMTIPNIVKGYIEENCPGIVLSFFSRLNYAKENFRLFSNTFIIGYNCDKEITTREIENIRNVRLIKIKNMHATIISEYNLMSRNAKRQELIKEIVDDSSAKDIVSNLYNAMRNKFNKLYDEYYGYKICVIGQMLIISLLNKLYNNIDKFEIFDAGSDNMIISYNENDIDKLNKILDEFENITRIKLERKCLTKKC